MAASTKQTSEERAVSRLCLLSRVLEAAVHAPDAWSVSFDGGDPQPLTVSTAFVVDTIVFECRIWSDSPAESAEVFCQGSPMWISRGPFGKGRFVLVSLSCRVPASIG